MDRCHLECKTVAPLHSSALYWNEMHCFAVPSATAKQVWLNSIIRWGRHLCIGCGMAVNTAHHRWQWHRVNIGFRLIGFLTWCRRCVSFPRAVSFAELYFYFFVSYFVAGLNHFVWLLDVASLSPKSFKADLSCCCCFATFWSLHCCVMQ